MANKISLQWDLVQLRTFVAVSQLGSLTKVGANLGLPQSAISKQVARLEVDCGGRLFHRTGRGMVLTELGERVLPRMKKMLADAEELSAEVNATAHIPRGDVRVGALPSLYLTLIVPLFSLVRKQFPEIRLQIFEGSAGQIDQWLANGYVDIGLPYRYGKQAPSDVEHLVTVDSYLMGAPISPLLRAAEVGLEHLDNVPLVLPGAPSSVRLLLDQLAKRKGISLKVVLEADSTQIQKSVAATEGIYTILPRHAAATDIALGTLRASKIINPTIERMIVMGLTVARPTSFATTEVAKALRMLFRTRERAKVFASIAQKVSNN